MFWMSAVFRSLPFESGDNILWRLVQKKKGSAIFCWSFSSCAYFVKSPSLCTHLNKEKGNHVEFAAN